MGEGSNQIKSPKLIQQKMNEYFDPDPAFTKLRARGYNIVCNDWIDTSKTKTSPRRVKVQTKNKSKTKTYVQQQKMRNSLDKWISEEKNCKSEKQIHEHSTPVSKKPLKFSKTDSFEKYGIVSPSVEDILKERERMEKEAQALKVFENEYKDTEVAIPNFLNTVIDVDTSPQKTDLLHCKHISLKELEEYFKSLSDYIMNIFHGVEHSQRHEMYKNHTLRPKLIYNTSTIVFSQNQIGFLMELLEKSMNVNSKHTEYLFMVLMPELCLRIFMKVHDMSKDEAVAYLDWRPVE